VQKEVYDFDTAALEGVPVGEIDELVPVEEIDEVLCVGVSCKLVKDRIAALGGVGVLCGVTVFCELLAESLLADSQG
jgi:hypothetical protein